MISLFSFKLKLNIFPFSASILTFSTQNHLILTYFTHFDTTHFFYKYYNINIVRGGEGRRLRVGERGRANVGERKSYGWVKGEG